MLPGKKPPWLSATSYLGKPCVYFALAADHEGSLPYHDIVISK